MSITDIIEIDLPTILVMVVLWLINYFQVKKLDSGPRR